MIPERKKILVTGGAGFIGSRIASALIEAGHEVHIIDNLSTGFERNIPKGAHFHLYDIADSITAQFVAKQKYHTIFHQAAQIDVRKSVSDPAFDAQINIISSIRLMEAAVKAGTRKIIFASSGGAGYGEQDYFPADENHPLRPLSPYGIAKISVEHYLYYYLKSYNLSYIALRYSNVYGPFQSPHGEAGVVAIFINHILNNHQPQINGDGKQTRDYVFIKDVVNANLKALEYEGCGSFNVGTGTETTVNELFDTINTTLGSPFERKHAPAKAGEQLRSVIANQKIKDAMSWEPKYNIKQGLQETIEWFKAQKNTELVAK